MFNVSKIFSAAIRLYTQILHFLTLNLFEKPTAQLEQAVETPVPVKPKRIFSKKRREENAARKSELQDLLEGLDHAFLELSRFDSPKAELDAVMRKNLRDLGPLVTKESWGVATELTCLDKLPALAFVSFKGPRAEGDSINTQFLYACKVDSFDQVVQGVSDGIRYECGVCYTLADNQKDDKEDKNLRLQWLKFNVVVNPETGHIKVCKRRYLRYFRFGTSSRAYGIHRPVWDHPIGISEEKIRMMLTFALNFTAFKNDNWTISVRRRNQRMTFVIPDNQAKLYFNDRVKVHARDGQGRSKPIMHIVATHIRKYKSGKEAVVPMHVRGLRQFEWKDYSCAITAPEFHPFANNECDLKAYKVDADDPASERMKVDNLGEVLAILEHEHDVDLARAAMSSRHAA